MGSNDNLENGTTTTNPFPVGSRGGSTRSWGTTTGSGQSVSTSGSAGSPSTRSEAAMAATPASENTFLRLNHLEIHADDAGSQGLDLCFVDYVYVYVLSIDS